MQKSHLAHDKVQKYTRGCVCVTEIDCPMRLRAAVFIGVMTPVRLLDFATGLTFLLLGS